MKIYKGIDVLLSAVIVSVAADIVRFEKDMSLYAAAGGLSCLFEGSASPNPKP